jgi:hypothetical protein
MEDTPDRPPATQVASRLLVENLRSSAEEIRVRYLSRRTEYPADWQAAVGELFSAAHVTAAELNQLREKLVEVMIPYLRLDPAERPPGALPVRVVLDLFPWFAPEEARQAGLEQGPPGSEQGQPGSEQGQ